jgi:hypothetical protein
MSELSLIEAKSFIGSDFLTWLLVRSEIHGGGLVTPKRGQFQLVFDRKVVLTGDAERVAWSGQITSIDEMRAALQRGKKVLEAQFHLTQGKKEWHFTLNGRLLQFRGLKTPKLLSAGDAELLFDKLDAIAECVGFIDELFAEFVEKRMDPTAWARELLAIHTWLTQK